MSIKQDSVNEKQRYSTLKYLFGPLLKPVFLLFYNFWFVTFHEQQECGLADSGFFKNFLYQGCMKSSVSWVFEDLKFKISEGYDPKWCFPDSAQLALRQLTGQSQENTNLGLNLLKF